MSNYSALDIFDWDGQVGRARYLGTGLVLLALKHNLDRLLAYMFGYRWSPISYWVLISPSGGIKALSPDDAMFYVVLLLFAMPFIFLATHMLYGIGALAAVFKPVKPQPYLKEARALAGEKQT